MDMEPATKRRRYFLRSQRNDPNTLNVRYWTRSKARPLGGIELLHQSQEENTVQVRKRKCHGKKVYELLDLNAFCILGIFEKLNLIELATVADTNSHLRKLAHYHFQSKYSQPKYEIVDFDKIKESSSEITIPEAAKIFRHFGKYMRGLKIRSFWNTDKAGIDKKALLLIKEYCTPMLNNLHLMDFYVGPADARVFYSLFRNLHHLILYNIFFQSSNKWAIKMPLCKSLEFNEIDSLIINDFLKRSFPALEKVSFRYTYGLDELQVLEFIHRHPNLRHISIIDEDIATADALKAIGTMGLRLESFEFNGLYRMSTAAFLEAVKPFGAMKALKSFTMNCFYHSVEGLLEDFVVNGVPIEHLHLKHAELNGNAILHLHKLKTIKTLAFQTMDSPNADRLFCVASKMSSLREFEIMCYESISCESLCTLLIGNQELSTLKIDALEVNINFEAFNGLVNILKRRPQQIKLNIEFFNSLMKLNVPQKTIEVNNQWIAVKPYDEKYTGLLFDNHNTSDEFEDHSFDDDSFEDDSFDDIDDFELSLEAAIGFNEIDILGHLEDFYESNQSD